MKLIISIVIILAVVLPVILTSSGPEVVTTTTTTTSTIPPQTTTAAPTVPPVQLARWARTNLPTPPGNNFYREIVVDLDGSIYVVGRFVGQLDFGNNVTLDSPIFVKCLIVKYDSNGIAQWARTINSVSGTYSEFNDIKIGNDGNIYVVGNLAYIATYDFGNGVNLTTPTNDYNPTLVVYNSSGFAQWTRTIISASSLSTNLFQSISISTNGNIYISGIFSGVCNFGNNVSIVSVNNNAGLVKYNSSGVAQWAKNAVCSNVLFNCNSYFTKVSVALDESIYVSGNSRASFLDFGNNINFTAIDSIGFLIKYNSNGFPQWVKPSIPTNYFSKYNSVNVDLNGNIYIVGLIIGQITYDFGNNVNITSTNIDEACILVKYNSSGFAQWAQTSSGGSFDGYFDISNDINGNIYAVGYVDHQYSFDYGNGVSIPAMNISYTNPLIVKYDSFGVAQWAKTSFTNNTIWESSFEGVSTGLDGSTSVVGTIRDIFYYDFGDNVNVTGGNTNTNFLIVKYA